MAYLASNPSSPARPEHQIGDRVRIGPFVPVPGGHTWGPAAALVAAKGDLVVTAHLAYEGVVWLQAGGMYWHPKWVVSGDAEML